MKNKKNKNSKYFSTKKILYFIIGIILIILLAWYIYSWYIVKNDEKFSKSYLTSTNTISYEIKDINEINSVLNEAPSNLFIYISYENDENVYKLEKKLKSIIDDYNLSDVFYYVNISNYLDDNNDIYENLDKIFNSKDIKAPTILYIEDNEIKEIINNNDIYDTNNFIKLLKDNNYDKKK